jgi:GST-like protein
MTKSDNYEPPKKWIWKKDGEGIFASINRPVAGSTHRATLPRGRHALQLYSQGTPNGQKVTIMLEELLAQGYSGAEYDAHLINIGKGDQFGSDFVEINPNSKIPALEDYSDNGTIRLFESGAILLYLAEKFEALIPTDARHRAECLNWLFWQMGSAPYLGGGFGHFYVYAPEKIKYCIDRYTMEVKRQLDVLDRHLSDKAYMCGGEYSIADIAIWPWYGAVHSGSVYDAAEFLDTKSYKNVGRWAQSIAKRPGVKRGRIVNRTWGPLERQLHERHDASDFDLRTQNKLQAETNSHPESFLDQVKS